MTATQDGDTRSGESDWQVPVSKWGPDDRIGAGQEITADVTRKASELVRQGQVVDLSHTIGFDAPRDIRNLFSAHSRTAAPTLSPYVMCMWTNPLVYRRDFEADGAENGFSAVEERIEMDTHIGTHLDALGHVFKGDKGYNGVNVLDEIGHHGLVQLGAENIPPLAGRGVLLDIPARGRRSLEGGEVVTLSDLRDAVDRQAVDLQPGDLILIRTGWGQHYGTNNDKYTESVPGIDLEGAQWLSDQGAALVGSDTMTLEVFPMSRTNPFPVHQHLLVESGIYILENAQLETLAELQAHTFFCLCLAPKFRGSTGSPVRLVAIL